MTIIAYRGGFMACDSQGERGQQKVMTGTKIAFRDIVHGSGAMLVGRSGDASLSRHIQRQMFDLVGNNEGKTVYGLSELLQQYDMHIEDKDSETNFLVVLFDRSGGNHPIVLERYGRFMMNVSHHEFCAIGCGAYFAIGAMECGASAGDAVSVAIKYSASCGGPIHTYNRNGLLQ